MVKDQTFVAWFFITVGFSVLISTKIKLMFIKVGISLSLIIAALTAFLLHCTLPLIVIVLIHSLTIFTVMLLAYLLFIKQKK